MDELLKNYIKHIQVNFSAGLADDMNLILNKGLQNETPIEEIEKNLQNRLCDHFRNLKSYEFEETAKSLYEAYVDYDDENLIRSVRFLIRIYSKFLNLKLAKFFCDWRIKTMRIAQSQNINKLDFNHQTENLNNTKFDFVNEKNEKEIYFDKNKIDRISRVKNDSVNTYNENNNYDYDNQQKIDNKNNNINVNMYGNKLNYNYKYDPSMNNFEKIDNDSTLINQSYENKANRSIEEKYSKINIKAEGDIHDYNSNITNVLKSQRIKKINDSEDEKKRLSQPQIRKDGVKIINNSFSNNKDTSINSKTISPSNVTKQNNFDYNIESNSNSRLINNKEEKRMEMKIEKQKKEKNNSNSMTIFDKLFLESYKKSDEKLLNEEIKKLSELDECTFQPNVNNKRGIF